MNNEKECSCDRCTDCDGVCVDCPVHEDEHWINKVEIID